MTSNEEECWEQVQHHQRYSRLAHGIQLSIIAFVLTISAIIAAAALATITGSNWGFLVPSALIPSWILLFAGTRIEKSAMESLKEDIPNVSPAVLYRHARSDCLWRL